jgi:hypothetical protein
VSAIKANELKTATPFVVQGNQHKVRIFVGCAGSLDKPVSAAFPVNPKSLDTKPQCCNATFRTLDANGMSLDRV